MDTNTFTFLMAVILAVGPLIAAAVSWIHFRIEKVHEIVNSNNQKLLDRIAGLEAALASSQNEAARLREPKG